MNIWNELARLLRPKRYEFVINLIRLTKSGECKWERNKYSSKDGLVGHYNEFEFHLDRYGWSYSLYVFGEHSKIIMSIYPGILLRNLTKLLMHYAKIQAGEVVDPVKKLYKMMGIE